MGEGLSQALLGWVAANPGLSGLAVALIAFTESLIVVGLVMPGAVLLLGVGALTATGALPLMPTLAWAAVGALAGDWLSFYIGHRFSHRLRRSWLLRNRPELIERGLRFFDRHGGKSLFIGRFVGPVRPILPAVAGMMRMPVGRFLAISTVACLLWSPAYLLPGALFGASLGLAAEVGGRLVVLMLLVLALIWITLLAAQLLYRLTAPHARQLLDTVERWSLDHRWLGRLTGGLVDPQRGDFGPLLASAVVLVGGVWAFSMLAVNLAGAPRPSPLDQGLYDLFQGLRLPAADRVMIVLTYLGEGPVLVLVALVTAAWLALRRRTAALAHWAGAAGFAALVPWVLKELMALPRPAAIATTLTDPAFPSGHTTGAAVLYGFLAVLVAADLTPRRRWRPYAVATVVTLAVGLSRLYLGVHWSSDVFGALILGAAWVALLGIAYRRHASTARGSGRALAALVPVSVALALLLYTPARMAADLARYQPRMETRTLAQAEWPTTGWRQLSVWRHDLRLRQNHPLNVQWAGSPTALREQLASRGWRMAPPHGWRTLLAEITGEPLDVDRRPVLPQIHDGRYEEMLLWKPLADETRVVLRLWRSAYRLVPGERALYVGNVTLLDTVRPLPLLRLPRTRGDFDGPLALLRGDLGPRLVARVERSERRPGWNGTVLLTAAPITHPTASPATAPPPNE